MAHLTGGDETDDGETGHAGTSSSSAGARPTTLKNTSDRSGGANEKLVTAAVDVASASTAAGSTSGATRSCTCSASSRDEVDAGDVRRPRHGTGELDVGVAVGRARPDLTHVALQDHPTAVDDHHLPADVGDEVELVAAEQQARALGHLVEEDLLQDFGGDRVEPGERLVEHQQIGVVDQRQGELHPLLVAARQILHVVAGTVGEVDALHPAVGRRTRCRLVEPAEPGVVDEVVAHPHPRVHAALGRHVAEAPPVGGRDRRSVPGDRAAVERQQLHDRSHRRRLARPVRAQEADELAALDAQADAVEGDDVTEALADVGDLEHVARPYRAGPRPDPSTLTDCGRNLAAVGFRFTARPGHPTFIDLPWERPLDTWQSERIVSPVAGIHRHVVRFVAYGPDVYALKELPGDLAEREYRLLRELAARAVPVVEAVGVATGRAERGRRSPRRRGHHQAPRVLAAVPGAVQPDVAHQPVAAAARLAGAVARAHPSRRVLLG